MSKVVARLLKDSLKVGYTKTEEIAINGLVFAGMGIGIWAIVTCSSVLPEIYMARLFLATALFALSLMLTVSAMKRRIKHNNETLSNSGG